MEKKIRELYTDHILNEAMQRFDIGRDQIALLDGFESFVYQYQREESKYILRISHPLHRSLKMTLGEIDWMNYLARNGVSCASAILSPGGNYAETIPAEDGSLFTAVSFTYANGHPATREEWKPPLFKEIGRLVGRMNRLAKDYVPADPSVRRPEWYEDMDGFADKFLPPSEAPVAQKHRQTLDYLRTLPVDRDSYGMIHQDVHSGNFFVEDGRITLFDFDDCLYAWFVYDIAMAIFYCVRPGIFGKPELERIRVFYDAFMDGYASENTLERKWLAEIPTFLKLREIDLYVAIHRSMDLNNLDDWCSGLMNGRRERILSDLPYMEMDFTA